MTTGSLFIVEPDGVRAGTWIIYTKRELREYTENKRVRNARLKNLLILQYTAFLEPVAM